MKTRWTCWIKSNLVNICKCVEHLGYLNGEYLKLWMWWIFGIFGYFPPACTRIHSTWRQMEAQTSSGYTGTGRPSNRIWGKEISDSGKANIKLLLKSWSFLFHIRAFCWLSFKFLAVQRIWLHTNSVGLPYRIFSTKTCSILFSGEINNPSQASK